MKRIYLIIIATIFGLGIFVIYPTIYHNIRDYFAWNSLKTILTEENVSSIELSGYRYRRLDPLVQKEFLQVLQNANFKKSNWQKSGPTSEVVISINFKNGTHINFGYWGGDTFETTYKDRQFLINSSSLALKIKDVI